MSENYWNCNGVNRKEHNIKRITNNVTIIKQRKTNKIVINIWKDKKTKKRNVVRKINNYLRRSLYNTTRTE
jgi:hypothetical protein